MLCIAQGFLQAYTSNQSVRVGRSRAFDVNPDSGSVQGRRLRVFSGVGLVGTPTLHGRSHPAPYAATNECSRSGEALKP